MKFVKLATMVIGVVACVLGVSGKAQAGGQVWINCHITCRCLHDNSVGNFSFDIAIDRSHDIGFQADQACKAYGHRVCSDGCNGLNFSYSYRVISP